MTEVMSVQQTRPRGITLKIIESNTNQVASQVASFFLLKVLKNNIWKGDASVRDSTKRISDQAKLNGDSVTNSLKVTDLFIYSFIGFFFCEYNGYCIVCSIYMILFSSTIELLAGEAEDIYIDL